MLSPYTGTWLTRARSSRKDASRTFPRSLACFPFNPHNHPTQDQLGKLRLTQAATILSLHHFILFYFIFYFLHFPPLFGVPFFQGTLLFTHWVQVLLRTCRQAHFSCLIQPTKVFIPCVSPCRERQSGRIDSNVLFSPSYIFAFSDFFFIIRFENEKIQSCVKEIRQRGLGQ